MSPGPFGARVRRSSDPRLLTGRGAYVDDLKLAGMLHMAVWRSPLAESRAIAEDALELIDIALEPLEPVASTEAALRSTAPQLHDEAPKKVCAESRWSTCKSRRR